MNRLSIAIKPAFLAAACLVGAVLLTTSANAQSKKGSVYLHSVHENIGIQLKCEGCHAADKDGTLKRPGFDQHKPCTNSACHANEYRTADSKFCFACHTDNKPWANPLKKAFKSGKKSEFWVGFSHKDHLARAKKGTACVTCHATQSGKPEAAPSGGLAPGHALCNSCHEALATPPMTDCGSCHKREDGSGATAAAGAPEPWRVRAKFQHELHQVDVRTAKESSKEGWGWKRFDKSSAQKIDCTACHGDVKAAGAGQRPKRPTMARCAGCHNGTHSFKVTGFDCAKCHGPNTPVSHPDSAPASAPASSKATGG